MDEELLSQLDRLQLVTAFGRHIVSHEDGTDLSDPSYPLRVHLGELSRQVWRELLQDGRMEDRVQEALNAVYQHFTPFLDAPQRPKALFCFTDSLLAEHQVGRQRAVRRPETRKSADSAALLDWYISTDPFSGLELLGEKRLDSWPPDIGFGWGLVYELLALLEIDLALRYAEAGEPFKAAVAVSRASECHTTAIAYRWSKATTESLGRQGADARHASNRAKKAEAIRLYESKRWASQARAARAIGEQLKITERVVERWIRAYRKGASSGTVST